MALGFDNVTFEMLGLNNGVQMFYPKYLPAIIRLLNSLTGATRQRFMNTLESVQPYSPPNSKDFLKLRLIISNFFTGSYSLSCGMYDSLEVNPPINRAHYFT